MRIIYWISDVCSSDPTYANIFTMNNASGAALNDPAQFPYHFAFANSKSQDVAAMTAGTKKLVELGTIDDVEKVATLIYNSGVSQIVKEAMEKQFPAAGVDIVANENLEPTATDITGQRAKIRATNPEDRKSTRLKYSQ